MDIEMAGELDAYTVDLKVPSMEKKMDGEWIESMEESIVLPARRSSRSSFSICKLGRISIISPLIVFQPLLHHAVIFLPIRGLYQSKTLQ